MVENMEINKPFGDTSTARGEQGVNSTWDQVKNATNDVLKIGDLEIRIPTELAQTFVDLLKREYQNSDKPIFETASDIIKRGIDAYENSCN